MLISWVPSQLTTMFVPWNAILTVCQLVPTFGKFACPKNV